jgi:hypothetical protein
LVLGSQCCHRQLRRQHAPEGAHRLKEKQIRL